MRTCEQCQASPVRNVRARFCQTCSESRYSHHYQEPHPCVGCGETIPPGQARYCDPCRASRHGHREGMTRAGKVAAGLRDRDDLTDAEIDALFDAAARAKKRRAA